MFFDPRKLKLLMMIEGENIVSYVILFSVMLMETSAFTTVYQIVFHNDTGTSLISIKSPAAIIIRINMMDYIIVDTGSGRDTQCVNGSHIGQFSPTDMMNIIVSDLIINGVAIPISPDTDDGNT